MPRSKPKVLTFLAKDQAFKLSRHYGNRSRHASTRRYIRVVLEKHQTNSFSRLCPTERRTALSSDVPCLTPHVSSTCCKGEPFLQRPQSSKPILRAPGHQYSQKRQKFPEPRILSHRRPPCRVTDTLIFHRTNHGNGFLGGSPSPVRPGGGAAAPARPGARAGRGGGARR